MNKYDTYYENYLCVNKDDWEKGKAIFSCPQRDKPLNLIFINNLIGTKIDEKMVFSISPKFYTKFCKYIQEVKITDIDDDNFLMDIDDFFADYLENYSIRRMYRLTVDENQFRPPPHFDQVATISDKEKYLKLLGKRGKKFKEREWRKRKEIILQSRYFIIYANNEVASNALISDIDFNGANIVVNTNPNYRRKGYGKAVVAKTVEWCFKNNKIPIYWVDTANIASIKLAESLGFQVKSKELVITTRHK
jgi:RimJ/RimL family protein N-acetyltransferase